MKKQQFLFKCPVCGEKLEVIESSEYKDFYKVRCRTVLCRLAGCEYWITGVELVGRIR